MSFGQSAECDNPAGPCACGAWHGEMPCALHGEVEGPGVHTCGECGHTYSSWKDLVLAFWDVPVEYLRDDLPWEELADRVFFCPLCVHDF